jgi:hypothetical protein
LHENPCKNNNFCFISAFYVRCAEALHQEELCCRTQAAVPELLCPFCLITFQDRRKLLTEPTAAADSTAQQNIFYANLATVAATSTWHMHAAALLTTVAKPSAVAPKVATQPSQRPVCQQPRLSPPATSTWHMHAAALLTTSKRRTQHIINLKVELR